MNRIIYLIAIIFSIVSASAQTNKFKQINSSEFHKLTSNHKGILLDVRKESEFKNGHIIDAGQLNYYAFDFTKKLLLLPRDKEIYLYCNTGYRSEKAAKILAKNGYTKVYNLQHGIMEWNLQNLPVVMEPDARPDTDHKMNYEQFSELIQSESLVFIDFYAPWCAPCRKMMPMIDSLKVEYQHNINIVKVNVDASKKLAKELKLKSVPYLALYHKGNILFSKNGYSTKKELQSAFNKNITLWN